MNKALESLFLDELARIYDAENQLLKALPWMAKFAGFEELQEAFDAHHKETERHVERLLKVFELIGILPRMRPCGVVQELIIEMEETAQQHRGGNAMDVALIGAAQKLEHFEIAAYGCLATWAGMLDYDPEITRLLNDTLLEEKETDDNLWEVIRSMVTAVATAPMPKPLVTA